MRLLTLHGIARRCLQRLAWQCLAMGGLVGGAAMAQGLPAEVDAALLRAKIPREAVAVLVQDAEPASTAAPRINHRGTVPMNPASVMKLVTTYAALDLLGPAFRWSTPVYVDGPVRDGTLAGHVYIKGQGDPKLVLERLWLLLRRLQGLGIRNIAGDMVLDRAAFDLPEPDPASFDGEPLRPYNVAPDALLINYKAAVLTFAPLPGANVAHVQLDPPLAGVQAPATVPLSQGPCGDYRAALKADFSDPNRIRFAGSYRASCGEQVWPVAYADPKSYGPRALQGMWIAMGGTLGGSVRYGTVPLAVEQAKPLFELRSNPLAEVIRDINKYSNNVMAQQLFLTLGRVQPEGSPGANGDQGGSAAPFGVASFAASRTVVQRWWRERIGPEDQPVLDNGSGLSRHERISTQALGQLLRTAYRSPHMSELMSSLPIRGIDGTLRRSTTSPTGSAHLKTGTLANASARAGYVDASSGRRYVLAAIINHPNANTEAARAAMEALVDWTMKDGQ